MNRQMIFILIVAAFVGCAPSEQQIRGVVKDELAAMMERRAISDAKTIGPYSPAQQVGNFLFVSGQIALKPETGKLENADIETETEQVLFNLMNVLKSAGYDSSDVVSTTVYLKDINDFVKMNTVYAKHFQEGNYPARATVQVAAMPRDARIEITAIAYKHKKLQTKND